MPLKLLIVTEGYPWGQNVAGIFHRDQFHLLAGMDIDVTVVAPMPWVPPPLVERSAKWRAYAQSPVEQTDGALKIYRPRYLALPRENALFAPDLTRYLALRALALRKPDVIQSYFAIPTGGAARLMARTWKVPHAVGMLGDDVNIYPYHNARNRRLLTRVLDDAAYAFANGPTLAAKARELTGIDVPWLSIGASEKRFAYQPERAKAREKLGWPQDRKVALYVGALTLTKGIGDLIVALNMMPDRDFTMVAIGDGPMRGQLSQVPDTLCMGARSAADVALAMTTADLHVHPSHYEGLPTVLVEAAFAKLPILTTDAPGCIDMAQDGRAIMAPAKNPQALAAGIATAMGDAEAGKARAARMLEHAREHYSLEKNAAALAARYHRLAGRA
jgi:teichuronic acid biosynthesis glycosyltransferase TuaC